MPLPGKYAADVVRVLQEDLPQFDEDAVGVIITYVSQFHSRPWEHFEIIVDQPISARWRLKARESGSNMVRLADYAFSCSEQRTELCAQINARLAAL